MIKKLRKKFILTNMALVTLVLLIVFSAICFSSYQRLQNESYDAMRRSFGRGLDQFRPHKFEFDAAAEKKPPQKPVSTLPVFCVELDQDGRVLEVTGENVEVSEESAKIAAEGALEAGGECGVLPVLGLRYLREISPEGTVKIAFADTSGERESILNLILTSVLIGAGGLAAFFLISLFLSELALRPAERAWQQQRQFVADASHELKTPLTVILANTGILLSHRHDTIDRQIKWVEYTQAEANRMKKLVDDLLFLAKNDAARLPVLCGEADLSDAVWSCLLPFESVAFEQGLTLNSDIAPSLKLSGDEGQIRQLTAILLDNACKYAGEKGVITVRLERAQDKARLTVNNTGDPIPSAHLERLFERFYRSDEARSREKGGYGLGLAIAKSIVQAHRGKISVESSARLGTTFTVILPLIK